MMDYFLAIGVYTGAPQRLNEFTLVNLPADSVAHRIGMQVANGFDAATIPTLRGAPMPVRVAPQLLRKGEGHYSKAATDARESLHGTGSQDDPRRCAGNRPPQECVQGCAAMGALAMPYLKASLAASIATNLAAPFIQRIYFGFAFDCFRYCSMTS
jgi:hypothetical protein